MQENVKVIKEVFLAITSLNHNCVNSVKNEQPQT